MAKRTASTTNSLMNYFKKARLDLEVQQPVEFQQVKPEPVAVNVDTNNNTAVEDVNAIEILSSGSASEDEQHVVQQKPPPRPTGMHIY